MALFSKGVTLTQHKEPAFSGALVKYTNSQPVRLERAEEFSTEIEALTASDLIKIAKLAHIHDEQDGRLLVSKLRKAQTNATSIIIDAIDDEPYVSSKLNPMLQCTEDFLLGIELCRKIVSTEDVRIQAYKHISDLHTPIPSKIGGYPVERLKGGYPALPSADVSKRYQEQTDALIVSVGSLIHFARAVRDHIPQTSTFITVAGNCVANPMNIEVSLGMNVTDILERCGLFEEPSRVIVGGPMTGIGVIDTDSTQVTFTTRAILAMKDQSMERAYSCIGCGRCETSCPVALNPMYIMQTVNQKLYHQLRPFDAHYCIGCGTCSYVCPSRLDVSGAVEKARDYAIKHFFLPDLGDFEEDTDEI